MFPRLRHRCATVVLLAGASFAVQDSEQLNVEPVPLQPDPVRAVHFSGQTFLTWRERPELDGESYRIYRSLKPITDVRAPGVEELGFETWEGSGIHYAGRIFDDRPCEEGVFDCGRPSDPMFCWRPRYVANLWIPDGVGGAREVQEGEGLLAWTLREDDFPGKQTDGWIWYAVTTVAPGGHENPIVKYTNRASLYERADEPLPVEIPRSAADCSVPGYCPQNNLGYDNPLPAGVHLFLQYMDLREWNSTFHAPNALNCWWGEDPGLVRIRRARQYAYTYTVSEPDPALGPVQGPLPVVLDLHAHAGNAMHQGYGSTGAEAYAAGGAALKIIPIDVSDTWWFGFADSHDYRLPYSDSCASCTQFPLSFPPPPPYEYVPRTGGVVNYTEYRVLRMLHDLERAPLPGFPPDPNRRYVRGSSMGGSGALALSLRYPDVFAAAAISKPMTDPLDYLVGQPAPLKKTDFRQELPVRWGAHPGLAATSGLPLLTVTTVAPRDWADPLQIWNGLAVWDWQDHVEMTRRPHRRDDDTVPFGILTGIKDKALPYATQGEPFYQPAAFPSFGRAWGGVVSCQGHAGGAPEDGMPPSLSGSASNPNPGPFSDYSVRLNESVPGFSSQSSYVSPPGGPTCTSQQDVSYYQDVIWSSSWYGWDTVNGPPLDQTDRWEVSLKWVDPSNPAPMISVVPRRLQQFDVEAGALYRWMTVETGSGKVLQPPSAPFAPTTWGLLRIDGVRLSTLGGRLIVIRVP